MHHSMTEIIESIQSVVASAIRFHKCEMGLDRLDHRAAVQLGIILTSGALEVLATQAALRESKTTEGAKANRALLGDVQNKRSSKSSTCVVWNLLQRPG